MISHQFVFSHVASKHLTFIDLDLYIDLDLDLDIDLDIDPNIDIE